ncbi:MAG TPA: hypothetical protein VNH44_00845 [Micropepsaceae bacterium]|nr:hypothetical protein [Micropepsaceae bacterium]
MLHVKADWFDPTGKVASEKAEPGRELSASETARLLRERAARYRELAKTLYNESLISEVESLARELDDEAAMLEVGAYPYFEEAFPDGF